MTGQSNSESAEKQSQLQKYLPSTRRQFLSTSAAATLGLAASSSNTTAKDTTPAENGSWSVKNLQENIEATIEQATPGGQLTITIRNGSTTVLESSPLGVTTYEDILITGLVFCQRKDRIIEESYQTPIGPRPDHSYRAKESTLRFFSTESDRGSYIEIDVRVSSKGAAYRYRLLGDNEVGGEWDITPATAVDTNEDVFNLPDTANMWASPEDVNYEGMFQTTSVGKVVDDVLDGGYEDQPEQIEFPVLIEVDDSWMLLTESNVDSEHAASRLQIDDEDSSMFHMEFPQYESNSSVTSTLPYEFPWRTFVISSDLNGIVRSDLVTDLNENQRYSDTSWIKPGKAVWSWWSDSDSPQNLETQKRYVDYASEHGWPYILVDRPPAPDGPITEDEEWFPKFIDYANKHDVGVWVWMHHGYLNTQSKREARLPRMKEWGVVGLKIDHLDSDSQSIMQFYDEILEYTANLELMVNFHGSTLPKGRRRRWPHLLTSEAVRGAEYYKFGTITPEHNTILPFTRNVVGPMDYTPVTFSASDEQPETTVGHELALSVVFESGIQHFADEIETYRDMPKAENFLAKVPVVWDKTKFINGRPGSLATIARKDRNSPDWYIGSISASEAQGIDVSLSFLDDDQVYAMKITRDDNRGENLVVEQSTATANDTVSIDIPENGGFSIHLSPNNIEK